MKTRSTIYNTGCDCKRNYRFIMVFVCHRNMVQCESDCDGVEQQRNQAIDKPWDYEQTIALWNENKNDKQLESKYFGKQWVIGGAGLRDKFAKTDFSKTLIQIFWYHCSFTAKHWILAKQANWTALLPECSSSLISILSSFELESWQCF